jgi:hypothetical protein
MVVATFAARPADPPGIVDPQNRQWPDRSQPVTQGRLATYR